MTVTPGPFHKFCCALCRNHIRGAGRQWHQRANLPVLLQLLPAGGLRGWPALLQVRRQTLAEQRLVQVRRSRSAGRGGKLPRDKGLPGQLPMRYSHPSAGLCWHSHQHAAPPLTTPAMQHAHCDMPGVLHSHAVSCMGPATSIAARTLTCAPMRWCCAVHVHHQRHPPGLHHHPGRDAALLGGVQVREAG